MGPTRFELVTSSLSGTRSNQLSYEPDNAKRFSSFRHRPKLARRINQRTLESGAIVYFAA